MSGPPSGGVLEPVWLVEATYAPDAAETRVPFRAEHLAGIRERLESGVYIEAGAFADVSASVILVRAERRRTRSRWSATTCTSEMASGSRSERGHSGG